MNNINHVYYLFPLLLLGVNLVKNNKIKFVITYLLFVFLFVMAQCGPDYFNYEYLYNNYSVRNDLHGEPLYVLINKFFYLIGIPYWVFRLIYLSAFLLLFLYSLNKLSFNFIYSFIISYLMFLVYFISAYRQFATISIFMFSICLMFYKKGLKNEIITLILNTLIVFIHTLAIYQLLIFVAFFIYHRICKKEVKIDKEWLKRNIVKILIIVLSCRVLIYFFAYIPYIQSVFDWIPYFKNLKLINLGFLSRAMFLSIILYLYFKTGDKRNNDSIYLIYFVSMLIYFILPFDTIVGRLINNIRFLECVFVPNLIISNKEFNNMYSKNYYKHKNVKNFIILLVCFTAFSVFFSQMLFQDGYDNYRNIVYLIFNIK